MKQRKRKNKFNKKQDHLKRIRINNKKMNNKDKKSSNRIKVKEDSKIFELEKNTIVGTFQKSRNFGFVVPDDRKLGTDIFISKKDTMKAKNNQKVVVEITKMPFKDKSAEGKIIEIIGNIDEAGVDMMSLIKEYDLPYEFPFEVMKEAKSINQVIDEKDIINRKDLREEEIFTIDGEDAKDLDDAVNVKKLPNGNYMLGVHIADVSNYVREGSALDKEAILRGTSVYMLDRVIPMLPVELSNGICSLNEGKDRFAISCVMEIDKSGQVVSSDIFKSIINVTRRMSYTNVQKILDNSDEQIVKEYEKYINHFKLMEKLAHILKERRNKDGALNLDIPETKVVLNENGIAVDIKKYELTFANEIIEQFMLTANETVAEKFFWLEAPFIYRVHEAPDMEKVDELNKFLYNLGYRIKTSKDEVHPKAFATVLDDIKGKPEERVISNLILRTLKVARYESENKGHFGIASKYYCHFTSPIRRYPDLFIHRIISKYLKNGFNLSEEEIEKYSYQSTIYSESSSEREKIAQKVERESVDIKMAEYMQEHIGEEYDGIISSIMSFGMFVELENTVEGMIRFDKLGDEYFIYDENTKTLLGEKTKTMYHIGDHIRIRVIKASKELRQIDFEKVIEEDNTTKDIEED
jgi:ribonuclease R